MKRWLGFETLLVAVYLVLHLYAASSDAYNFPNAWFTRDDAYYYFKVAQNISEGRGSTFDGIHPTNGYHPLWLLVCIPIFTLARWDVILPLRVLLIVLSLLRVLTAILIYRLLRQSISRPVAILAAAYWVFDRYIHETYYMMGLESSLAFFFLTLLLFEIYRLGERWQHSTPAARQIAWLALLAALTFFSRLDLIFLVLVAGMWIILRQTPFRYLLPLDLVMLTAATLLSFVIRLGFPGYYSAKYTVLITVFLGLLLKIPAIFFFGLYERPGNLSPAEMTKKAVLATAVSSSSLFALLIIGQALSLIPNFSKVALLVDAVLTLSSIFLTRLAIFGFQAHRHEATIPLKSVWKQWFREGLIYYGLLGGLLAIYMLWNKIAFGTFMPVSGQIKRWWGTFPVSVYGGPAKSLLSFFMLHPKSDFNAWNPAIAFLKSLQSELLGDRLQFISGSYQFLLFLAFLTLLGYAFLRLRAEQVQRAASRNGVLVLFVGSWLQIFYYNILGYASLKEWYWLAEQLLLVFTVALMVEVAFSLFPTKWTLARVGVWVLVALFSVRIAYAYGNTVRLQMPHGVRPADTPYLWALPELESHTEPGALIGMTGGGSYGYFIRERTIVNMDGLINSYEYFQALRDGKGADYLYASGMRYVFANPLMLEAPPYEGQYTNRLELVADLGGKDLMRLLPASGP
ncbi:MAG: hypothetical protein ACK4VW_04805 [Anaerolineales bacterium]